VAVFGLLAVLASYFTCTKASTPEDGAIYAAAITAALDRADVLPGATVYVIPSVERRTDKYIVDETDLSPETRESIARHLGRSVRFADPDEGAGTRVALGAVQTQNEQRSVQVQLFDPAGGPGFITTYVLEREGRRWRVVRSISDGVVQPS
jgi:hypothetical protein